MLHWEEVAVALSPGPQHYDEQGVWSGSAFVVRDALTAKASGFPEGTVLQYYTGVSHQEAFPFGETQNVAYSTGEDPLLLHWAKAPENPLLEGPPTPDLGNFTGFRDPAVWQQHLSKEGDGAQFIMVVGGGLQEQGGVVFVYDSVDLLHWTSRGLMLHATGPTIDGGSSPPSAV